MTFPRARLAVSAALFLGWLAFLAYLAMQTRDLIVLSRPQFAVAEAHVLVKVAEQAGRPGPEITIEKVMWSGPDGASIAAGRFTVFGLEDHAVANGWRGPGTYLVPLSHKRGGEVTAFAVTPIPMSPGYLPQFATVELASLGEDKAAAADLVRRFTGWAADRVSALEKGVLRRNVPLDEADQFKRAMSEVKASVRLREEESRIYLATEDVLAQYEEVGNRK